ncbi:MAG: thioredoxin [Bacilli bacterium]
MEFVTNLNGLTDELTLVDFFATWCGPCKMLAPVLEQADKEVKILEVDVDKARELASEYGIASIPTLILFKNKKVLDQKMGYMPYNALMSWINQYK